MIKVEQITSNQLVMNSARITVWKDSIEKEPSSRFMNNIYRSEHSPIRNKIFRIYIEAVPYWLSVHFTRHHVGSNPHIQPFIATNRDDRVDIALKRDELTNVELILNAQSIIDISKLRLCDKSHIKTQKIWNDVLEELKKIDEELYNNCVPSCIYRGFCPEMQCCGRLHSDKYKKWRKEYIGSFESF